MLKLAPLALLASLLLAPALADAPETRAETLSGEYYWEDDKSTGDLEAVFTPTSEGRWTVAFHFTFSGTPHTYEGTAQGSLGQGELRGEVKTENQRRTFTFQGSFSNGTFRGTHAELRGGREHRMGTLELGRRG